MLSCRLNALIFELDVLCNPQQPARTAAISGRIRDIRLASAMVLIEDITEAELQREAAEAAAKKAVEEAGQAAAAAVAAAAAEQAAAATRAAAGRGAEGSQPSAESLPSNQHTYSSTASNGGSDAASASPLAGSTQPAARDELTDAEKVGGQRSAPALLVWQPVKAVKARRAVTLFYLNCSE